MRQLLLILITILSINTIFATEYLSADSEYLEVYFEKLDEGGYIFYADNNHFIPQFVNLGFTKLTNLQMDRENPSKMVLEPGAKKIELATLTPISPNKSYSFRSRLTYANGDPLNVAPDDYAYLFPFAHGTKHKLDQGFGGKFSHQDENFYALDFSMDIGTEIYAARDGVVIEVKEDSNRGGASSSYAKDGNYISIYHSDGTFASYVHLKKNGAEVEVGDIVSEGDFIGYSGNTGLSTGPHLHFSVNVPSLEGVRQSIPIKMKGLNGEPIDPTVGEYYYSSHPGKEYFEIEYGKDLTNADYDGYIKDIKKSNTLSFRDETVDSTTIVFCRNGYDKEIDARFSFNLQNSVTSKNTPIEMVIPPLSEVYITLVNPKDSGKPFAFSYSISYRVLE